MPHSELQRLNTAAPDRALQTLVVTRAQQLPGNLHELAGLVHLVLHDCSQLQALPAAILQLHTLHQLHLSDCAALKELPEGIGDAEQLQVRILPCP